MLAALTTLLNVRRRELGVVGGGGFLQSPLLPHRLDWLPRLDMLECLLPRQLGMLPPSWNGDSGSGETQPRALLTGEMGRGWECVKRLEELHLRWALLWRLNIQQKYQKFLITKACLFYLLGRPIGDSGQLPGEDPWILFTPHEIVFSLQRLKITNDMYLFQ